MDLDCRPVALLQAPSPSDQLMPQPGQRPTVEAIALCACCQHLLNEPGLFCLAQQVFVAL
jgi:hypothetical protein